MELHARQTVACPHCGNTSSVSLPDEDVELRVRRSVAAFGEHATVTCPSGHTYWVYYC